MHIIIGIIVYRIWKKKKIEKIGEIKEGDMITFQIPKINRWELAEVLAVEKKVLIVQPYNEVFDHAVSVKRHKIMKVRGQ